MKRLYTSSYTEINVSKESYHKLINWFTEIENDDKVFDDILYLSTDITFRKEPQVYSLYDNCKIGKTKFLVALGTCISNGYGGKKTDSVLYVSIDDELPVLTRYAKRCLGYNSSDMKIYTFPYELLVGAKGNLILSKFESIIQKFSAEDTYHKIVIFDSICDLGYWKKRAMQKLQDLADKYQCSIILSQHERKDTEGVY